MVVITDDFYVGKHPVTQRLWEVVMITSYFKSGGNRPVEEVSWFDCIECISFYHGRKKPVYTLQERTSFGSGSEWLSFIDRG